MEHGQNLPACRNAAQIADQGTLRLTSRASESFLEQSALEQRRLIQTVVEKASWKDGSLQAALFEPFEILRHSNRESYRKENEEAGSERELEIWLLR